MRGWNAWQPDDEEGGQQRQRQESRERHMTKTTGHGQSKAGQMQDRDVIEDRVECLNHACYTGVELTIRRS